MSSIGMRQSQQGAQGANELVHAAPVFGLFAAQPRSTSLRGTGDAGELSDAPYAGPAASMKTTLPRYRSGWSCRTMPRCCRFIRFPVHGSMQ